MVSAGHIHIPHLLPQAVHECAVLQLVVACKNIAALDAVQRANTCKAFCLSEF